MSLGVMVVEGAQYSGSLITVRLPMSLDPNQLIKQGAKLITGWENVVEELPTSVRAEPLPDETATSEQRARRGEYGSGTNLATWTSESNVRT
jgi:predicted Rossmann fold nucleotide-binding protein DprA/Smf involved in DNA uptake